MNNARYLINGVHYHVKTHGEGERTVLLLHGMPDTSEVWAHQVAALVEAGFCVVTPDMLGYGETEKPADPARYAGEHIIEDLLTLIAELGLEKVDLIGHDWGAYASWVLVTHAPELFNKHVAISIGHPDIFLSQLSIDALKSNWYMYLNALPGAADLYLADDCAFYRQYIIPTHPDIDEVCDRLRDPGAMQANLNWDVGNPLSELYLAERGSDSSHTVVTVPTLGIWSAGDAYLPEDQVIASQEFMAAEWRYVRLESGSHWCMLDNREATTEAILDWLR